MRPKAYLPSSLGAHQRACFDVGPAIDMKGTHCPFDMTATEFQRECAQGSVMKQSKTVDRGSRESHVVDELHQFVNALLIGFLQRSQLLLQRLCAHTSLS